MAFVAYPHPALARVAQPRAVDDGLRAIGETLRLAAIEARAFGLAGAHLGIDAPVIAINASPEGDADYRLMFNPRIAASATETEAGREASVALPGIEAEIVRPVWVDVTFEDGEGSARAERFAGFLGRVVQHEIEQMNGRFFLMNLSRLKREMLLRKASKRR